MSSSADSQGADPRADIPVDPQAFGRLVDIMQRLRSPDGCGWDRQQTHDSLTPFLVEECYELLDAIEVGDDTDLKEELGDVLLQVVFHAQIAAETDRFAMADVIETVCDKMVQRHPHVFGDAPGDVASMKRRWDVIKREEKPERESVLDGIPSQAPALLRAAKLQKKAAKVGFDWPDISGAYDKLAEETAEVKSAAAAGDADAVHDEIGDLLFSVVNIARFLGIEPESALRQANRKFERRFRQVEQGLKSQGKSFEESNLDEMDALWESAKADESDRP